MPTILKQYGRAIALAISLPLLSLLVSCGGRLSEALDDAVDRLADRSRLLSATVTPNPVPKPVEGIENIFSLKVNFDSTGYIDVIRASLENPVGSGNYVSIGNSDACSSPSASPCGTRSITISCRTTLSPVGNNYRGVTCFGGANGAAFPIGKQNLKLDIIARGSLGGYRTAVADDELALVLSIQ